MRDLVALGLIAPVCLEAALLLRDLRVEARAVTADVAGIRLSTEKAEGNVAAIANTGAQILAEERGAFSQQEAAYAKLAMDADLVLGSANDAVVHINRVTLPTVDLSVLSGSALMTTMQGDADETTMAAEDQLARVGALLDALKADAENPAIPETMERLDQTAAHVSDTAAHFSETSQNLEATSADIQAFVHRETAPVRGTWNVIKSFLREFAGPGAQVATAIK